MRKFGVFAATLFICILLAGIYGILHDQLTYSLSPEYFTKFKYRQFGFEQVGVESPRQTVAIIGFLATWWMGLIIGILVGLAGLLYKDHIAMKKAIIAGVEIVFITALSFAFIGFFYGKYYLISHGVNWFLPGDLIDKNNFIVVGSIHNFSYTGGIAGLLIAVVYLAAKSVVLNRKK